VHWSESDVRGVRGIGKAERCKGEWRSCSCCVIEAIIFDALNITKMFYRRRDESLLGCCWTVKVWSQQMWYQYETQGWSVLASQWVWWQSSDIYSGFRFCSFVSWIPLSWRSEGCSEQNDDSKCHGNFVVQEFVRISGFSFVAGRMAGRLKLRTIKTHPYIWHSWRDRQIRKDIGKL
jgi:hypothetical protein